MPLETVTLTGNALLASLPALARLRIEVFRDYPYLYDGTIAYEREYLDGFASAKDSIAVVVRDGDETVGCSTGSALSAAQPAFAAPFLARGFDIARVFYCAESVLLGSYRGLGLGNVFFDRREAHALQCGYTSTAFMSVIRPGAHPLRPLNYKPLDGFWMKRGYSKLEGSIAMFDWKDIGDTDETAHPMQVWMRGLG